MLRRRLQPYVLLFVLLSALYHSNLRPIASGDSLGASLIPFAILLDGSIALDRFGPWMDRHIWYSRAVIRKARGHWYSGYPIGGPVLATPLYAPLTLIPAVRRQRPAILIAIARVMEKVVATALAAAAAVALLFLLRRLTSERTAWILTLVFALGTGNWTTNSQALWPHTFGLLPIISCLYCIERWSVSDAESRWYWIVGVCAACALAIRPTNVALLPALALALWLRKARVLDYVRVFAFPLLSAALIAAYNFALFQKYGGRYPMVFNGGLFDGLAGILVSPGRGLLIYTPIAIFALCAFFPGARESRKRHRLVLIAASVFLLLHMAIIAAWPVWWGGYCWGPRLLTEVLPSVMVLIAIGWPAIGSSRGWQYAFATAAVYCVLIQAIGAYFYPKGHWDHLPVDVDHHPERLWNWKDNPVIRTAQGGFAWEPYSIITAVARDGLSAGVERLRRYEINPY